jgi:hypothetical protein
MAADLKLKYGTDNQTITITLASNANNVVQASTVVDNTANLYKDALVMVKIKTNASGTSATGYLNLYFFGTVDTAGPTYPEGATGTDGTVTLTAPPNLPPPVIMNAVANATSYTAGPFSVRQAFGGSMPEKWGVIIENKTGAALDSTAGNHKVIYQGQLEQSV